MAVRIISEDEFRTMLRDTLDGDLCWQIVGQASGYDGSFPGYDFFDSDEFYSIFCNDGKRVKEVIEALRYGTDLDEGSSPADPFADYLAWSEYGTTIDSTNDPAQVVYDDLLDDIIDYIVDNVDEPDIDYPSEVQEVIDEYLDNRGEEEE